MSVELYQGANKQVAFVPEKLILGRVAYRGERILISKRGKPLAMIVPSTGEPAEDHLSKVQGWLEDSDPFSNIVDQIVHERERHIPRISRVLPPV